MRDTSLPQIIMVIPNIENLHSTNAGAERPFVFVWDFLWVGGFRF